MNKFQLILAEPNGSSANNALHNVFYNNRPENLIWVFNCAGNEDLCPVPYPEGPYPALMFFWETGPNKYVEVFRMNGAIDEEAIRNKLEELKNEDLSEFLETGSGGDTPVILPGAGQNAPFQLGIGLFNLNLPLPWWVFALVAAIAADRAVRKNSIVWGLAAFISAMNAYNKKNNG